MGQEGVRYQVASDPKNLDRWGQVVTTQKNEEPPYDRTIELKLLNVLKATHNLVDDPNIALYMKEIEEAK